jgi:hypothetical protein
MTIQSLLRKPAQTVQIWMMMCWTLTICSSDKIEEEDYICGVDTTYYLVPSVIGSRWKRPEGDCLTEKFF